MKKHEIFDLPDDAVVSFADWLIPQKSSYNLQEMRLLAICVAYYCNCETGNQKFVVRVTDLLKFLPGLDAASGYKIVKKTLYSLGEKKIKLPSGEEINWFSEFTYHDGQGEFDFQFSPKISPSLQKRSALSG